MSGNIVEVLYLVESPAPGIPSKGMCESMRRSSAPVVRCRDCQYYTHSSWHRCDLYSIAHEVEPDGYCAWGERKEDGE